MYRNCTTEKSALQQRRMEQALLELLQSKSYGEITVCEICEWAGLSRKVFYRLFEQKADVVYALIDHTIMDLESYQPDISIVGEGGMHRFLGYWKEQRVFLDALIKAQCSYLLAERAIGIVLQEGSDILRSFGAENSESQRETAIFFLSGIFALVLNWHKSGYNRSIDEMSAIIMKLLMTRSARLLYFQGFRPVTGLLVECRRKIGENTPSCTQRAVSSSSRMPPMWPPISWLHQP